MHCWLFLTTKPCANKTVATTGMSRSPSCYCMFHKTLVSSTHCGDISNGTVSCMVPKRTRHSSTVALGLSEDGFTVYGNASFAYDWAYCCKCNDAKVLDQDRCNNGQSRKPTGMLRLTSPSWGRIKLTLCLCPHPACSTLEPSSLRDI